MSTSAPSTAAPAPKPPPPTIIMLPNLKELWKKQMAMIDKLVDRVPILLQLSEELRLAKTSTFAIAILALVAVILTIAGVGGDLITGIVGTLWPAYMGREALNTGNKDEMVQWLSYWMIFGMVSLLDFTKRFTVAIMPYYYFFKLVLILYLGMPQTYGATKIYNSLLKKPVKKPEPPKPAPIGGAADAGKKPPTSTAVSGGAAAAKPSAPPPKAAAAAEGPGKGALFGGGVPTPAAGAKKAARKPLLWKVYT
ncbi:Receptor expression-enhancing protein 5 [Quaeritorhiza haematococci]|nr:Receptor expression-enhancing protein 5 [Quaeritorhiza haematococci]